MSLNVYYIKDKNLDILDTNSFKIIIKPLHVDINIFLKITAFQSKKLVRSVAVFYICADLIV